MMRERYLLCFLLVMLLLYQAVPRLQLGGGMMENVFVFAWLGFAFCAAAGNMAGFLYGSNSRKAAKRKVGQKRNARKRAYGS